jgi:MFS family permease
MNRLPFFATLIDAVTLLWRGRKDFLAFAYLPVIANALLGVALQVSLPSPMPQEPEALIAALSGTTVAIWLAAIIAGIGFYIVFAIAWHRHCLLPGEVTTIGAALRWRSRHWRFFGMTMALTMAALGAAIIANFIVGAIAGTLLGQGQGLGVLIPVLVTFAVLTQFMRLLPVFPAIALDDRSVTLGAAWRLTRGNGATLFMLLFTMSLALAIIHQVLLAIWLAALGSFIDAGSPLALLALALLVQLLAFIGIALTTTIVSIAYRDLKAQAGGGTV